MAHRFAGLVTLLAAVALLTLLGPDTGTAIAQSAGQIDVSGRGSFETFSDALAAAQDGDVITVRGGVHNGPFVIERSVEILGIDTPVFDGGGFGTIISVQAPDVTIRGLHLRNSGLKLVTEDAAIEVIEAPGALIEGNQITQSLFGVYLKQSPDSIVRGNHITGKDLLVQRRGDAIRVWSSNDTLIEDNIVTNSRDVVLWYSERLVIRGNEITEGRYGLHFMYDDDAIVEDNRLTSNSVGAFLMYSRRLTMRHNVIGDNRGPSGYGIGMKDLDDAVVTGNLFADNRVGAYVDNSPREIDSYLKFTDNVFTLNDYGVRLMPSVKRNEYTGNTFADNQEQVEASGGGTLEDNLWSVDGVGNYWSDYAGYDSDSDGIGDIPYEPQRLFEKLVDQRPELRILTYSPAAQAIDFAAEIIPFVRPEPKLADEAPLMAPGKVPGLVLDRSTSPLPIALASLGLIAGGAGVLGFGFFNGGGRWLRSFGGRRRREDLTQPATDANAPVISVTGLRKQFGKGRAVDGVSFDIASGEGIALWGPNGAGKTTIIRCMLGVYSFEGEVTVCGHNIRKDGKKARQYVGLVPQEIAFHDDLTVRDTIQLYARLRKVGTGTCDSLLEQLQLTKHVHKQVRQLSGGLKQRLALAVALLGDPPVLFLDEPTANLDAAARREFIGLLEQLKAAGKTLVFASHRPAEVTRLADRVLSLEDGKLIADVSPSELTALLAAQLPEIAETRSQLRIEVGAAGVAEALSHLIGKGFEASRNGTGIYVQVDPGKKAEPVASLIRAGLAVTDFELHQPQMEISDD